MVPAEEWIDIVRAPRFGRDDGLVMHTQLTSLDCPAQFGGKLQALAAMGILVRAIHHVAAAAALRNIHGHISLAQENIRLGRMLGSGGHANAGADVEPHSLAL